MSVISVDGPFFRGIYKGKLITAVGQDANNYILSLVFAIVDEETNDTWK
jgi:hypothetical protein